MTNEMKQFLTELSALIEKHGIDFDIEEYSRGYSSYAVGIEVGQTSIWNEDGAPAREYSYLTLPKCFDGESLLAFIEKEK